jgi:hypothetical protein
MLVKGNSRSQDFSVGIVSMALSPAITCRSCTLGSAHTRPGSRRLHVLAAIFHHGAVPDSMLYLPRKVDMLNVDS